MIKSILAQVSISLVQQRSLINVTIHMLIVSPPITPLVMKAVYALVLLDSQVAVRLEGRPLTLARDSTCDLKSTPSADGVEFVLSSYDWMPFLMWVNVNGEIYLSPCC
jgi:hypothetical protein